MTFGMEKTSKNGSIVSTTAKNGEKLKAIQLESNIFHNLSMFAENETESTSGRTLFFISRWEKFNFDRQQRMFWHSCVRFVVYFALLYCSKSSQWRALKTRELYIFHNFTLVEFAICLHYKILFECVVWHRWTPFFIIDKFFFCCRHLIQLLSHRFRQTIFEMLKVVLPEQEKKIGWDCGKKSDGERNRTEKDLRSRNTIFGWQNMKIF